MPQTPNSKSKKASTGALKNVRSSKAVPTQEQSSAKKKTASAPKKATAPRRKVASRKSVAAKTASAKSGTSTTRAAQPAKKAAAAATSKARTKAPQKDQKGNPSWVANVRANLESRGNDVKKFNIRLLDIAHKDTDQFFDMSRAVVRARSWPEVMEIQAQYVSDRINCYRADEPSKDSSKNMINVFAWIAKQAGVTRRGGNAALGG